MYLARVQCILLLPAASATKQNDPLKFCDTYRERTHELNITRQKKVQRTRKLKQNVLVKRTFLVAST